MRVHVDRIKPFPTPFIPSLKQYPTPISSSEDSESEKDISSAEENIPRAELPLNAENDFSGFSEGTLYAEDGPNEEISPPEQSENAPSPEIETTDPPVPAPRYYFRPRNV